jgi:hypothetical protein
MRPGSKKSRRLKQTSDGFSSRQNIYRFLSLRQVINTSLRRRPSSGLQRRVDWCEFAGKLTAVRTSDHSLFRVAKPFNLVTQKP